MEQCFCSNLHRCEEVEQSQLGVVHRINLWLLTHNRYRNGYFSCQLRYLVFYAKSGFFELYGICIRDSIRFSDQQEPLQQGDDHEKAQGYLFEHQQEFLPLTRIFASIKPQIDD